MKTAMQEIYADLEKFKGITDTISITDVQRMIGHYVNEKEKQQTEDFAIGFAEWIPYNAYKEGRSWETYTGKNNEYTIQELLEIYKKEKGL